MAISACKFIGLTVGAVLLGIASAVISFGQWGSDLSNLSRSPVPVIEAGDSGDAAKGETVRAIRHIKER